MRGKWRNWYTRWSQKPVPQNQEFESLPPQNIMKVVKSKKGLRTILSVIVDKKNIQTKLEERLKELQRCGSKGFSRKVPLQ